MFTKIAKLLFNKKKESVIYEDDEYYDIEDIEEIELPKGDVVYSESTKILIVSKKQSISNEDNMEWFRGIIKLDKVKTYLEGTNIDKGDLVEVSYKESIINGEVINREIQSIKKLEGISYNIKTDTSKVKKVYDLGFAKKGIEFENGHTYSEERVLCIDPCPTEEEENNIYRKQFMYEGDLCNETYLEIFKDGVNTGQTITIQVEKIRDDIIMSISKKSSISTYEDVEKLLEDSPMPKFPWIKDEDISAQDLLDI